MSKITVVRLAAYALAPEVIEIDNDLKSMQALVGGPIEHVSSGNYGDTSILSKYDIWCNEEGLLAKDILFNVYLGILGRDAKADLCLAGDIFVSGSDEEGDTTSVDKDDISLIVAALSERTTANHKRQEALRRLAILKDYEQHDK